jgi:hypothetical protein
MHHAIALHSLAHRKQASAHRWQCSWGCVLHSSPHAWQISAHNRQIFEANSDPEAIHRAASEQISAQ